MKKMIPRLVLSGLLLIAILVMPVSVFAVTDRDVSNGTDETLSALGCSVKNIIDDPCCKGYKVYVDGVYQFTEGQSGTPDGYCSFYVSAGTHTIKITKNGRSASKTNYFQCGTTYRWISMPHCWCEDDDDCKYPPTVKFDKTKYYEGDTVHATVSTSHSSVRYEIKDCYGTVRKSGSTSNGKKISYTIPKGASECCYWQICFYWDEDYPAIALSGVEVTVKPDDCIKCYNFYVCPVQTCDVYVKIEDPCCVGYKVYVDGKYLFTEGGDGTPPDGYCAFYVKEGTHTLKITKNGRSASKTIYFECNIVYHWVSMPKNWCGDAEAYVEIKDKYCKGYKVYVDDVYQFTEGQSGTPDGNCEFFVGEGTHTIEIRKNSRSASLTKYFECNYRYTWDSMPDHWCGDPCEHPPTVTFDKTNYYAGDTVHATVSTSFSSVYYQIKDCSGLVLNDGPISNGGTIYYTLPAVVEKCCNWQICLYWGSGMESKGTASECSESYDFFVCSPPEIFEDLIFLSGPVNAKITDQYGRVIDDTGINEIPNASFVSIGDNKKFFIPSDLDYTVDLVAYDSGELTYGLSSPRGNHFVSIIKYNPVIKSGTEASMLKGARSIIVDGKVIFPDVIGIKPSIQLHTGWNLFSLPKIPEAPDVLDVMQMVGNNLNSVWTYEDGIWKRYDLTGPSFLNDLITMEPGKGYWIDMETDKRLDELYIGSELTDKSIPLDSGWNLVGYNSLSCRSITDAMNSVADNWSSVWSYEDGKWKRYDLSGPAFLNEPIDMRPGRGYWIDMKSDATWSLGA